MNKEISDRLVKLRKQKGLSQEELAEKLGLSRQAISKWERCESSPDLDNIIQLAKLYDLSFDELLSTNECSKKIVQNSQEENIKYVAIENKKYINWLAIFGFISFVACLFLSHNLLFSVPSWIASVILGLLGYNISEKHNNEGKVLSFLAVVGCFIYAGILFVVFIITQFPPIN